MTKNPFSSYGVIGCANGLADIWNHSGVFQCISSMQKHNPGHRLKFRWQAASVSPEREINPWPGDVVLARRGLGLGARGSGRSLPS